MSLLTPEQIAAFHETGYHVFPGFFPSEENALYKADIDHLEALRKAGGKVPYLCEFPHLGPLISHLGVMDIVESLMGPGFGFHHLHAVRQDAGTPSVNWHQDYEQHPQTNRSHLMVHFFYYFNGLNGEIGDLLFVPKSQHKIVNNDALWHLGDADLPGTMVVNDLPPGSAVVVHSALWHARRAKPGGEDHPRYFADASYCQAGIRWPDYAGPKGVEILRKALALGLDREGRYAHLFDEKHFYSCEKAIEFIEARQGSLVLQMSDWKE